MYKNILKHFKDISSIPHCSFETSTLGLHVKEFVKGCGYEVKTDNAGNILCIKGEPKVCLQAHYDMVCMGKAPNIELYEEDGWLKAKDSSLGADNGMGMAIMMAMMEKYDNLECLFTNDEEVGLLGANNLEIDITSSNLLNLDSEDEDEVIIGCAGGVDIFGNISSQRIKLDSELCFYEIEVSGLDGGHSGVDIAKNIPNALKILALTLVENDCILVDISGGERNNSIPKNAYAKVLCSTKPSSLHPNVSIKELNQKSDMALKHSKQILHVINSFSQGVREYDEELCMPLLSINLSTLKQKDNTYELEFFARSMSDESLERIKSETKSLLEGFGFETRFECQTPSWQPVKTDFALHVRKICEKYVGQTKLQGIHAGLECGVIVKKQPHIKGVCSIGPTIKSPHSERERCLLSSVEKISKIVDEIIGSL
ncbi:MAG: M20/M25/M40 family metallo-hydrolase [Campylobacteraceae bacterium]|nr:M20/M25/M40 family metallo-hydrolase [Campylobacteraceae bacterium]